MRRRPFFSTLLGAGMLAIIASAGAGCPYTIRDAGFIVRDPSPYRLYVCVGDDTPRLEQVKEWVAAAATRHLVNSNVTAEVVNITENREHEAVTKLAESNIEQTPAAIVVSPRGRVLRLPAVAPGRLSKESIDAAVRITIRSARREELKNWLPEHWCVMLLAEGTNAKANSRVREAAQAAARKVVGMPTELGQTIETAPRLVSLTADDDDERLLLWSLGLTEGEPSDPRLAVVFGAGRRLGPVLAGLEITQRSVMEYLETLGKNCTCTSDPGRLLGPSVPLVWDEDTRADVREALGFDPEKPEVRMVLAGVWKSQMVPSAGEIEPSTYGDEYMELPIEPQTAPGEVQEPLLQGRIDNPRVAPAPRSAISDRVARAVASAVLAMVLVAASGGVVLLLRRGRQR